MSGKQRRRKLKREGNHAIPLSFLRQRFRESVLHGYDSDNVRPDIVRILKRHVEHLMSLPASQIRDSGEPSVRELEIARSEVNQLLRGCNNKPFESPALLDLFAAGVKRVGFEIEPGEDAPKRLLAELADVCVVILAIELRRLETSAKSLARKPEVFGLTGAAAEYFESLFAQYHDTVETLVQVATDLAESEAGVYESGVGIADTAIVRVSSGEALATLSVNEGGAETFRGLAGEFTGTFDELVEVARGV